MSSNPPLFSDTPVAAPSNTAPMEASLRDATFDARLITEEPFLRAILQRLYGDLQSFDDWYRALLQDVRQCHTERSAPLHLQDADRIARPDWFLQSSMVGYSAYVDRFGGTFAGVSQRIHYLREMGVTYLHLLPFLRARTGDNDGGFAVAAFDDLEPRLGTMTEFLQLTTSLRDSGISLCADLVLNHVADQHPWAVGAASGDPTFQSYFHTYPDRTMPDRFAETARQIFPQTAPGNFTWSEPMQRWIWTTFYPYQWDLNYRNPAVFAGMATAMLRLANLGIDIFRLDSTAFIWKREGTDCMNQPEAHDILQALRSLVNLAAPGVLLQAEAIVTTANLPSYFGRADRAGRECHLAYHSSLMAAAWAAMAEQSTAILRQVVAATPPSPAGTSWLTYVRCHDDIGWQVLYDDVACIDAAPLQRLAAISAFFNGADGQRFPAGALFQAGPDNPTPAINGMAAALTGVERATSPESRRAAENRLLLLYGLALAFGGLPVIYMGDEIAQCNPISAATPELAQDSRWLQRPNLSDELMHQRTDPGTSAGRVFARMRTLVAYRRTLSALAADTPRSMIPMTDPAMLALRRGDNLIVLFNFSERPIAIDAHDLGMDATRSWQHVDDDAGAVVTGQLLVAPWSMRWLLCADTPLNAPN